MKLINHLCFFLLLFGIQATAQYDVAINNGRVIDPETGLDDIKNIGITNDRIVEITSGKIEARKVIDATGLIVSPGFIDPHVHGITNEAHQYQVRDGVTTALELEGGVQFVDHWLESKRGNSIVNYGASAAHSSLRIAAKKQYAGSYEKTRARLAKEGYSTDIVRQLMIQLMRSSTVFLEPSELPAMESHITKELQAGAIGIGIPVGYYPEASHFEIFKVYQLAAELDVPIYSHVRDANMAAIQEAIANATTTGAALHIVHLNSMSLGEIETGLALVEAAQQKGFPITTEVYPYTAASTSLETVLFDPGWQEKWGMDYGDLQWQATGERLTEETFKKYRKQGGVIIMHMMKAEWIKKGLSSPVTMIGSDGMPYAPLAHPRTAGTYARILGKYVREEKVLSLNEAIKKMTLMPAKQLEQVVPSMRLKGRIQVGSDADITIFNPDTVIDKATFEEGLAFSEGIEYVLVNGTLVVERSELVEGVYPGRPVIGKLKR